MIPAVSSFQFAPRLNVLAVDFAQTAMASAPRKHGLLSTGGALRDIHFGTC